MKSNFTTFFVKKQINYLLIIAFNITFYLAEQKRMGAHGSRLPVIPHLGLLYKSLLSSQSKTAVYACLCGALPIDQGVSISNMLRLHWMIHPTIYSSHPFFLHSIKRCIFHCAACAIDNGADSQSQ